MRDTARDHYAVKLSLGLRERSLAQSSPARREAWLCFTPARGDFFPQNVSRLFGPVNPTEKLQKLLALAVKQGGSRSGGASRLEQDGAVPPFTGVKHSRNVGAQGGKAPQM